MTALLLALVLLLLPVGAAAQEPAAAEAAPPKPSAESLTVSTLAADISSAGYFELSAWCRSLGLDDAGSRAELQEKLARHYGVELRPPPERAAERSVTVRSARESQYFTLSGIDEKYVILTGDVVVEVLDAKAGATHTIRAGRILYNQTLGMVSAEGGVSYSLARAGKTESFEGVSMSFDLETSEAVFYDGKSSKSSTRGGRALTFFFQGDTISRLSNDTVVMEDGTFSSCDLPEDPHYSIRATKVWILAPGEWAIENAVLLVGRVPVLYLPVFFWPGDRVFFNPALGYRIREGTYVQTTTYLIGRREKEQDNPLSFLKLEETGAGGYDLELHGIFLRKVTAQAKAVDTGRSLKLMLDAYSRLGAYVGLAGKFPPLATFTAGIGFSRSLFGDGSPTSSTAWSQFWPNDGSAWWNSSSLVGLEVPFRFGVEGEFRQAGSFYSVSARGEYFSDPSFTSDFYARTEGLALAEVLEPTTGQGATVAKKSTLSWDLTSRFDLGSLLGLPPGVSLSFPTLNTGLSWRSRDAPYTSSQPEYWDPGKTFYYPVSAVLPDVALSLSGELLKLDLPRSGKGDEAPRGADGARQVPPAAEAGRELRPPYPSEEKSTQVLPTAQLALRDPARRADPATAPTASAASLTLSYSVQPKARVDHAFDYEGWTTKEDVNGSIRYRTLSAGGTASLTASVALADRLAEISLGMGAEAGYRLRFDPPAVLPSNWTDLLLSDYQQDRFAVRSTLAATVRPLREVPSMAGSSLSYRLGWRLYQLAFTGSAALPEFTPSVFAWDTATVPEHSLQGTLQLAALGQTDTLSVSLQLPPLDTALAAQLAGGAGSWKATLQGGVREVSGVLQVQPLILAQSIVLGGSLTASEDLQFLGDPLSPALDRSVSQLAAGGASASFTAERQLPVAWDGTSLQWKTTGTEKLLLPSSARLAYASPGAPRWYWKDRVRIDGSTSTALNVNLQRPTQSSFDFSLKLDASVSEFLELSFSSISYNTKLYRYVPAWAALVGESWVNPLEDLAASFNFWNIGDRFTSGFKIRTLAVKAVHHLHDWDLSFEYQGSPQLRVLASGLRQFEWTPTFSIVVQWIPVTEIRSRIRGDAAGVSLRG